MQTSTKGWAPVGAAPADTPPTNPSVPRTIDGIELNMSESLALLYNLEAAIDGPQPASCGGEPVKSAGYTPGIMDRLGGVNHTSLEIRQRLEAVLAKLSK